MLSLFAPIQVHDIHIHCRNINDTIEYLVPPLVAPALGGIG